MSVAPMTAADFEPLYAAEPDPWGYTTSAYERAKYAATLRACGPQRHQRALELGGSLGVFSKLLAPRSRELITIDASPTAVLRARTRLTGSPWAQPLVGVIPDELPDGPFDLVVASEVLYYLSPAELERTLEELRPRMPRGAALVAVHWRPRTAERVLDAQDVHTMVRQVPWLRSVRREQHPQYLLERLERR
ncbi:MAG: methyltransferase domain-containing protein [Solirubrobacteraceae bacterium]|nr:methyltransferase domain-containing protein [Solirubrobacteraceae bacterium]